MTQETNCSDAAKMLIERMATHPNDFEPGERFWGVMKYLIEGDDIGGFHIMSKRDLEAITAAAQQLHENKLMEYVLHKLLVKEERLNVMLTPRSPSKSNMKYPSQMQQQIQNPYANAAQSIFGSGSST